MPRKPTTHLSVFNVTEVHRLRVSTRAAALLMARADVRHKRRTTLIRNQREIASDRVRICIRRS